MTIIPIKPQSENYWIMADPGRSASKSVIWQIMVYITTVLRCSHVQRATETLLLQCYANRCRTAAAFTAFILRCQFCHACSTFVVRYCQWCIYILGFKLYFSLRFKLQTWMDVLMLIWFILRYIRKNKCWLKIENAQIVNMRRHRRRYWVRPRLSADERLQFAHYDTLMGEVRMEDTNSFLHFLRMGCSITCSRDLVLGFR
jgi:hypothetical protein